MQTFKLFALIAGLVIFSSLKRPGEGNDKTQWISLQEAATKLEKEKRPVLIDLYTDWCGWCKVMDKKTYSNKKVSEYIGQKFYAVKIDAESKQDITWNGKKYSYNAQAKMNDFAIYLSKGQLMFPTTVVLPADGSEPQAIPGYLEPKDFELIAKYFGEGHYGKTPFADYQKNFKSSW